MMFTLIGIMLTFLDKIPQKENKASDTEDKYGVILEVVQKPNIDIDGFSVYEEPLPFINEFTVISETQESDGEPVEIKQDEYGNDYKFYYEEGASAIRITVKPKMDGLRIFPLDSNVTGRTEWGSVISDKDDDDTCDSPSEDGHNFSEVNGWIINMDQTGETMIISRYKRYGSEGKGEDNFPVIKFAIVNPNQDKHYLPNGYNQGNRVDVFAGNTGPTTMHDQNKNNEKNNYVYLTSFAEIGKRPQSRTETPIDALKENIREFNELIKIFSTFLYAVSILTAVLTTGINIYKFATSSSHPVMRRQAITNLLVSFICTAILGGIGLFGTLILQITL